MTVDGHRTERSGSARAESLQAVPPDVSAEGDALLLEVAAGDHKAFEALYLRLAPGVFGVALCVVGDRDVAENVTREVFASLWRRAPSFDTSRGTARAWAMTITHGLALEAAQHALAPHVTPSAELAQTPKEESDAEADQRARPADDQQDLAIALAYYGGLTPEGVAHLLRLPTPTVATQIRDGLRRLGGGAASTA